MVKGRAGLYLEAWKFGVYLTLPVFASVYYSNPEAQKYWADYYQFIKYPENPNTNVKEKIRVLAEEKQKQREQREAYVKQLQELQRAAERSENYNLESTSSSSQEDDATRSNSWWRRAGRWIVGSSSSSST